MLPRSAAFWRGFGGISRHGVGGVCLVLGPRVGDFGACGIGWIRAWISIATTIASEPAFRGDMASICGDRAMCVPVGSPRSRFRHSEGIVVRHARACESYLGLACSCSPGFQAQVWSAQDHKTIRQTFRSLSEARAWRAQTQTALRQGTIRAPTRTTLQQAAAEWLAAAKAGVVRTRSGDQYKPSALRSYEQSLNTHVLPKLGRSAALCDLPDHLQDLVDRARRRWCGAQHHAERGAAVRAIYRRAIARSEIMINPTEGLTLPAVRARRERVARPEEAAALIAAVPASDQAIWATALYAGLRLGELKALRWQDIDLHRTSSPYAAAGTATKARSTQKPLRNAPRPNQQTPPQIPHRTPTRTQPRPQELAFGRANGKPFTQAVTNRARAAWRKHQLQPIGLHECRHTYASFMIAAGVNAKALSTYMGHSSITITLDRYGHLMPGNETEAGDMLNTYLTATPSPNPNPAKPQRNRRTSPSPVTTARSPKRSRHTKVAGPSKRSCVSRIRDRPGAARHSHGDAFPSSTAQARGRSSCRGPDARRVDQ